ncbi:hypothetical protein [Kineosporia succinea]|uniref:Uncharacterized protein n=1 Tax=Kineosporia succinea TaxID=84632 RepID=A0ABT9PE81_9ACTN|nr:hypothetical protein [Kineosporia succinea]MDP9831028.1 hypothetical protein [Kineosporia succinea]
MARLGSWVQKNIDGVIALVIAVVIATLDVSSDLDADTVNSAILLVLGVLAVAMLRDRSRKDDSENEIRDLAQVFAPVAGQVEAVSRAVNDAGMVRVLSGDEITRALDEARRHTDRWLFRGGTGTYIRAVTLPDLAARSLRDRLPLSMRLEVIDPSDLELCTLYVQFRGSRAAGREPWSPERTQRESYATVLAAAWYRQRHQLLDIQVGLSSVMPTLRVDLSASSLVITHERPQGQGLLVEKGKLLHDYLQTDLLTSFEQARPVPLDRVRHLRLSDEPTPDEVIKLFAALDLPLAASFLEADVDDITRRALHADNPYVP